MSQNNLILRKLNKDDKKFLMCLMVFALAFIIRFFDYKLSKYNVTFYAMNYSYGFISRGLVGTFWSGLNAIAGGRLMNYQAIYWFNVLIVMLYYVLFFAFFAMILRMVPESKKINAYYLIMFFAPFVFSEFLGDEMFGRVDIFLFLLSVLSVMLILVKKCEWLVVVFAIMSICITQGYVFTNANLILVLLLYLALKTDEKKKYFILFGLTLGSISVLFLYFEFFSHSGDMSAYESMVEVAKSLSLNGKSYNESLLKHEILGGDVFEDEMVYHLDNYREAPMGILLLLPYVIIGIKFFVGLIKKTSGKDKLAYLAVFLGAMTIVPELLLKVDYGRYFYLTFYYYISIVIVLYAMKDELIISAIEETKQRIVSKIPVAKLVVVYPMLIVPFFDVQISQSIYRLSALIFRLPL